MCGCFMENAPPQDANVHKAPSFVGIIAPLRRSRVLLQMHHRSRDPLVGHPVEQPEVGLQLEAVKDENEHHPDQEEDRRECRY